MLSKVLKGNPILMVGILFMTIFLFQLADKGIFKARRDRLLPTSCRAALVKLNRRIPEHWKTLCEGNNMAVIIPMSLGKMKDVKDLKLVKAAMYRELANDLVVVAKNSPSDNLERVDIVRLKLSSPRLVISAVTEGKFIVKLATITNKRLLGQHLERTVQVKEFIK